MPPALQILLRDLPRLGETGFGALLRLPFPCVVLVRGGECAGAGRRRVTGSDQLEAALEVAASPVETETKGEHD